MMKPEISQSLLDSLPIGGPIFDFNFAESWTENQGMFYASFTMENDTRECVTVMKLAIYNEPKILN